MASAGTPGLNFQPQTPAMLRPVPVPQTPAEKPADDVERSDGQTEVKHELMLSVPNNEVIEIESDDTGSSTSTSNPADESSGEDELFASEPIDVRAQAVVFEHEAAALVKHKKSKIIHSVPELEPFKRHCKANLPPVDEVCPDCSIHALQSLIGLQSVGYASVVPDNHQKGEVYRWMSKV